MSKERLRLGDYGEETAVSFLKKNGYRIVARKYRNKLGEVDIIALDADTLCFVEVKTKASHSCGSPLESVTPGKQRKIAKVALSFLKERNLLEKKARFDVVAVEVLHRETKLEIIKNAFELDGRYV